MFYAHFVLAKKGPLARIWLAAHWDKKLTKAHVFETNIESSVEGILQPKVKMALRTSGHLLLGIVRIYSRKAKYLLADCNEAFIKIKIAFRPGVVDLPEGKREAAVAAITLPEVFHDFDTTLPDITIDMDAQVSLNQSRAEDITLKEDYGNLNLISDDAFDDIGFDDPEGARNALNIESFDDCSLFQPNNEGRGEKTDEPSVGNKHKLSMDAPLKDDGFGGTVGEGLLDGETGGLFEPTGLFDDAPQYLDGAGGGDTVAPEAIDQPVTLDPQKSTDPQNEDDSDDDMYEMAPGSMGAPSPPSSPESPTALLHSEQPEKCLPELPMPEPHPLDSLVSDPGPSTDLASEMMPPPVPEEMPPPPIPPMPSLDHSMFSNEAESFALAPLDAMIMHGPERTVKAKRKRKLVVDEVKSISGEEMKQQLSDTGDIVATLDLAPPTKRLMHWKETGGVEKLFSLPGHRILSRTLTKAYLRHLTTRSVENEIYGGEEDQDELETVNRCDEDTIIDAGPGPSPKRRRLTDTDLTLEYTHHAFGLENSRLSYATEMAPPRAAEITEYQQPLFPPQDDPLMLPNIPHIMAGNEGPMLHSITPTIASDSLSMGINGSMEPLLNTEPHPPPQEPIQPIEKEPALVAPEPVVQNGLPDVPPTTDSLFDTLMGDMPQRVQVQETQEDVNLEDITAHQNKMNDFMGSDDEGDDFGAPPSVGPVLPEEQMADETYEQFEERILTKRTTHLLHVINNTMETQQKVSFANLVRHNKRKQVAQKFYTFLVLKKQQAVELEQDSRNGDLIITRGPKYDQAYNA